IGSADKKVQQTILDYKESLKDKVNKTAEELRK
ncbi:MAG TPA: 5-(carboxyamino)imidazole ribonucleotide mutase, partial [Flavobacteriaceae bacterium]|nr:5-(carboxyamino)imidazole ribonucleotide mutase [Flavobacteriaceae bacterium]